MSLDIQRILEDAIPEVEDLVERGLLSKEEVGAIMSKRREFETRIHRFEVVKTDYLQYIEYELNLDKLIAKRKQRLNVKRKGPGDNAGTKRINFIFDRALRKFQGDVDLWVAAIEFSQMKQSHTRISKLVGQAIRIFPHREGFWILAASHEFETNKNVAEARAVLMQALRVNPKSEGIWTEYFKLEFLFLHQILERRKVLGLQTGEEEPIIRGDVLKIIYRKAVEALGSSCEFRLGFVRESELFLSGSTTSVAAQLIDFILEDVKQAFGDSRAIVWLELAKRATDDETADKLLNEACADHPSSDLYDLVILRAKERNASAKVKELSRRALSVGMLTERSAIAWVDALIAQPPKKRTRRDTQDGNDECLEDILKELNTRFPGSVSLWMMRCEREPDALEEAVEKVSASESLPFWEMLVDKNEEHLFQALVRLSRDMESQSVLEILINRALEIAAEPSKVICKLEKKALNVVPLASFITVVAHPSLSTVEKRKVLEQCVERYPTSPMAWIALIDLEKKARDPVRVRDVTLRALMAVPRLRDELSATQVE